MISLVLVALVHAHGGEDHAAPAAPPVVSGAGQASGSSGSTDAVLRVASGPAGTPVATTLLLADFATSAPIVGATPTVSLQGAGAVDLSFSATTPGAYAGTATFPADGDYAGALVVTTPVGADLVALSGLHRDPPEAASASSGLGVGTVLGLVFGGLVLLGVGYAVGRARAAAATVALLAASGATRQVSAHGGEDHGAPAVARAADAGLSLPLESQFLLGLRTAPLAPERFQERAPALGRFVARPGGSATLRAPLSGELAAPPGGFPSPGTPVRAGQVLGVIRGAVGGIDRAALAASRQQAANTVAEARQALALAERDAASVAVLAESISDRARLERQQALLVARTALAEAERALAATGDGAGIAVRAPVNGRLGPTLARPGDQVQAGDPLFRVVDAAGLWLEARLPERQASGVLGGATARVVSTAFPDSVLEATVLDAGQEVDPATGMLTVTLAVDAAGLDLRPGMSATAWLGRGDARDALVVPDSAVVDSDGMTIAFVKVGPEAFVLRTVKLGAQAGGTWEVLSGVSAGERVVVDGTYPLRSLAGR